MGVKQATAFAPCHITGIFQIFDQSADVLRVGSKGAGASLSLGVRTSARIKEASSFRVRVKINGRAVDSAAVSEHVVRSFHSRFKDMGQAEVSVEHEVQTPIGAGFGTSGAAALSLALALNEALRLGLSRTEAAQLAHVAEVECRTGLGTVIAETYGGLEVRVKPGAPGVGEIIRMPVRNEAVVACQVFGPLSTRKFLTDRPTRSRINRCGGRLLRQLLEAPVAANFMRLSCQFAEQVGLETQKVRAVLDAADKAGVMCSMPMFGEAVFTITEQENLRRVLQVFSNHCSSGTTIVCGINQDGARVLQ